MLISDLNGIPKHELIAALQAKQFILHYQPIVKANNSEIVGMEALLRWQHPKHGILTPNYFLPYFESTGLILELGWWVLHAACQQIKTWHEMGFTYLCIAINFSAQQFRDAHFYQTILDVLHLYQLPPRCLKLEITETEMMQKLEANINLLSKLRKLGVQLSLDDFGVGYSSLSYLKHFPFNILKIDKSFIFDIDLKKSSAAIVKAIIALGKTLGLTLVAEGVENSKQLAMLRDMQCDLIQGYFYSKPVSADEFTLLLKEPAYA